MATHCVIETHAKILHVMKGENVSDTFILLLFANAKTVDLNTLSASQKKENVLPNVKEALSVLMETVCVISQTGYTHIARFPVRT